MHAIMETGGKQFRVTEGDTIYVEKLDVTEGETVTFDRVLLITNEGTVTIGTPVVSGAKVTASVVKQGKGKKIIIFKFKAKKNYRRKAGHRQPYTKLVIEKIEA